MDIFSHTFAVSIVMFVWGVRINENILFIKLLQQKGPWGCGWSSGQRACLLLRWDSNWDHHSFHSESLFEKRNEKEAGDGSFKTCGIIIVVVVGSF